jgi:hypothetical protein
LAVGNLLEHLAAEPLAELHYALLVARGAKVTALARIGQQIFVTAILALHPREADMQIAALQVAIDDVSDKGPPESKALYIAILPEHLQLLKMIPAHSDNSCWPVGFWAGICRRRQVGGLYLAWSPIIVMALTTIATIYGIMYILL